ncbi:MAG: response regulator [Bdellovibrionota bacterium]
MSEKVLVLDDEKICCHFLKGCLEEEGFSVKTALRGDEALQIADDFLPDVLISDWMLKDIYSGVDVARLMAEKNPKLRIIFITGMAAEALVERAAEVPPFDVLEKPVDIDELLGLLRK